MFSDFCLCHLCAKNPFSKSGAKKCQKVTERDKKCRLAFSIQKATPENMPLHGQETVKFWMLYQPLTTIDPPPGKVFSVTERRPPILRVFCRIQQPAISPEHPRRPRARQKKCSKNDKMRHCLCNSGRESASVCPVPGQPPEPCERAGFAGFKFPVPVRC